MGIVNWQQYEDEVFEELTRRYPGVSIWRNAKVLGRISQTLRQIDILIEAHILDSPIRIIVDAKNRTKPIDVNDVESFVAMMSDVEAHRGILISTNGYTKTATLRAHNEINQDVELDVYSLAELKHLQGELAVPFSGTVAAVLTAPFGWVIDATRRKGAVACLYQRGYDLDAAGKAKEWMYLNFWKKETTDQDLVYLLQLQAKTLHDAKLTYFPGVERPDAKTLIRLAEVPGYPTPEYTGFVEFEDFIIFAVLFTSFEMSKRNLRKLREILRTIQPVSVT
jgi:Restriction endonuclease